VIAFQAESSGMYTMQWLWTMARERLGVVVVLCANRSYRILQIELARADLGAAGPQARALSQLSDPAPSGSRSLAVWACPPCASTRPTPWRSSWRAPWRRMDRR
jgi:acetolactate synthase-1/2/3 large subunit